MIWIIGGTTEARSLINKLNDKRSFIVSVATYSGAEMLECENVVVNRMNQYDMVEFIKEKDIDIVVDMTHPYAVEVTQNAKAACLQTDIKYIRFKRRESVLKDCIYIDSIEKCVEFLIDIKGCVFFTTGTKNIKDFEKARGKNRFVYRILPSIFSVQECIDNNIKMEDIVAILGPVSEELNYQMFKDYKADYVVMKDSGKEGGTLEKIQACVRLGIPALVIGRQSMEEGLENIDDILLILDKKE